MQFGSVTLAKARFGQPKLAISGFPAALHLSPRSDPPFAHLPVPGSVPRASSHKVWCFLSDLCGSAGVRGLCVPVRRPVPMHTRTVSSILPFSEQGPRLTGEEWMLILKALSAYQHHESYQPLYEKLRAELSSSQRQRPERWGAVFEWREAAGRCSPQARA